MATRRRAAVRAAGQCRRGEGVSGTNHSKKTPQPPQTKRRIADQGIHGTANPAQARTSGAFVLAAYLGGALESV